MAGIRRDVAAILAAHQLDPKRKELYVEGRRDRVFLLWLAGSTLSRDARVVEIQFVEVPVMEGGERGRLLNFAQQVEAAPVQIRCFADADHDRLFNLAVPGNVWLTDLRDLEGYMLRAECLRRIFHLAANTDQVEATQVLATIKATARRISALRILSARRGLRLPFQSTELRRHVAATQNGLTLDFESYVSALLQNAGISLRELPAIIDSVDEISVEFAAVDDGQMVHGKDTIRLLAEVLLLHGVPRDQTEAHFFMSLESAMVQQYPTLSEVIAYLAA